MYSNTYNMCYEPESDHQRAVEYADNHTRYLYGDDAVPCEPGTEAHRYWLDQYDAVIRYWSEEA